MAKPRGLYTPVYASLPRHEKVRAAAEALKCDRHKLVGHLVALWTWCLDGYTDGKALAAGSIALGADWPARQAQRFADALADAGLLERVEGGYVVHEWDEYGGKVARIQQADRARHSSDIPQNFPGDSSLDEKRREETKPKDTHKPAKSSEVDEPFIASMVERYADTFTESEVRDHIENARGHKSWDGWKNKQRGVMNWLNNQRTWKAEREQTTGGGARAQVRGGYGSNGGASGMARVGRQRRQPQPIDLPPRPTNGAVQPRVVAEVSSPESSRSDGWGIESSAVAW